MNLSLNKMFDSISVGAKSVFTLVYFSLILWLAAAVLSSDGSGLVIPHTVSAIASDINTSFKSAFYELKDSVIAIHANTSGRVSAESANLDLVNHCNDLAVQISDLKNANAELTSRITELEVNLAKARLDNNSIGVKAFRAILPSVVSATLGYIVNYYIGSNPVGGFNDADRVELGIIRNSVTSANVNRNIDVVNDGNGTAINELLRSFGS